MCFRDIEQIFRDLKPARPRSVTGFISDGFPIYRQAKKKTRFFSVLPSPFVCRAYLPANAGKLGKAGRRRGYLVSFLSLHKYKNNILNYKINSNFFVEKYQINILKNYLCGKQSNTMQAHEITNRVREIMKARKITQAELAAKLQVSQNQVSQYLAGTPRLDTILAIADALQIEPAELFQDTTPPAPALAACPHCGAPLKIMIK